MTRKVRLTDEALRQIETIADHISNESPQNAKLWLEKLSHRVESLGTHPEIRAILHSAEEAGAEIRQTFFGVYRILYTIDEETVQVLAVRHGLQAQTS
jgi:plasmid stabilization system protein ParE